MPRSTTGPEAAIEALIAHAEQTLGWSDANNTVKTPVHVWYEQKFGNPDPSKYSWDWCDGWITYVAYKSGNETACRVLGGVAYTVAHANRFRQAGEWTIGATGIRRGDIVFFDWGQGIEHVGIVTGATDGGVVETIEGNTLNVVARRKRERSKIAGFGRPKYGGTTTPPPAEEKPTVPNEYDPPAFPSGLAPGKASPSAKPLQAALKAAGYMSKSIAAADNYGPNTEAAVAAFYRAHKELSDADYDPFIGPKGWDVLHKEAYGGAEKPKVTPPPPATSPTLAEPKHDYRRVTYGGRTVNQRTATMLKAARGLMGLSTPFTLTQGSYNRGVSASAGTHDGGGVVDISTNGGNVNAMLLALRRAGFAAWYRTSAEGFSPHIHACAIGDREMASGARNQVVAYFRGRNGLANNRADSAPASVGRPAPKWADKYR